MNDIVKKDDIFLKEDNSRLTTSIDYSGRSISKEKLMIYINTLIKILERVDEIKMENESRQTKINGLSAMRKRKVFTVPTMDKPTGLAALSSRRKREYEVWLSKAGERKAELEKKERSEDERIKKLNDQIRQYQDESFAALAEMKQLVDALGELCRLQIIAPEYRDLEILERLLSYLFTCRANTLSEAINVYHEEKHREQMKAMMEKQTQIAQQQLQAQRAAERNAQRRQMELLEEQARAARKQQSLLEDIRFYQQMNYWSNN